MVPASMKRSDFKSAAAKEKTKAKAEDSEEEEKIEEVRRMQRRKLSRSHSLSEVGTGGTPFMIYLKSIRDQTNAARIELAEPEPAPEPEPVKQEPAKPTSPKQEVQPVNTAKAADKSVPKQRKSSKGLIHLHLKNIQRNLKKI